MAVCTSLDGTCDPSVLSSVVCGSIHCTTLLSSVLPCVGRSLWLRTMHAIQYTLTTRPTLHYTTTHYTTTQPTTLQCNIQNGSTRLCTALEGSCTRMSISTASSVHPVRLSVERRGLWSCAALAEPPALRLLGRRRCRGARVGGGGRARSLQAAYGSGATGRFWLMCRRARAPVFDARA